MVLLQFDHIAIAVRSLSDAVRLYIDALGADFVHGGDDEGYGMRTIQLRLGGQKLELIQPVSDDCHLHRFIERHGEGFHHFTYLTPDVKESIRQLESKGYETVDLDESDPEWVEVYLRPSSGFGTLMQLAETTRNWQSAHRGYTLDDVLAGNVVWRGQMAYLRSEERN